MKKTFLMILIAILICTIALPASLILTGCNKDGDSLFTPPKKESEGLEFYVNEKDSVCYLKGIGSCTDTDILIPAEYNGYPVTRIMTSAFSGCDFVKTITVPGSVKRVESHAFSNCPTLEKAAFSEGLECLEKGIFSSCPSSQVA